jgi:zinc/manganese transport system permease protein
MMTGSALSGTSITWNIVADVRQLLQFPFMVNAFRAGTIVAVIAGALGWFMVLRRQSFAGHTLAVVSFPGASGAILAGISAIAGYFAAAVGAALVIAAVPRSSRGRAISSESAIVGTVQAFALACGALFVSLYGGFLNGLTSLLFGSFLGISSGQVLALLAVAAAALAVLALIARPLFFATVDPDVAAARGVPVRLLGVVFLVLLGCAAAEVSQITGALLVFALLVMPAATAQQITSRPKTSFAITILLGLAIVWLGLAAAYFSVYPVGFFMTTFGFAGYVLAVAGRIALTRITRRRGAAALAMVWANRPEPPGASA